LFICANQISEVLCFVKNCILQELLQIQSGTTQTSGIYLHQMGEIVEPSGVQALKNPNPLKNVEALAVLAVVVLV